MEAPTPVSTYLHSATMVKAGIYLLARLNPILGGTAAWNDIITTVGTLTMVVGAILALYQTDLKKILAYTTVSALGTLMLLIGVETVLATRAAIVFLLVHSLYKGGLFMVAGAIDHEAGTRDITKLSGMWHKMPLTAIAAIPAAFSMSGFPPYCLKTYHRSCCPGCTWIWCRTCVRTIRCVRSCNDEIPYANDHLEINDRLTVLAEIHELDEAYEYLENQ